MRLALPVSASLLLAAGGAPLAPPAAAASSSSRPDPDDDLLALAADDECGAASSEAACSVNALQLVARLHASVADEDEDTDSSSPKPCEGVWCKTVMDFCALFDTDDPWKIQEAVDNDAQYANYNDGVKIAVTKSDYYLMYHKNVARKLNEFLPQKIFSWKFGDHFETIQPTNATLATVVRNGHITFNMGWWKRKMFWNYAVRSLPQGETFPYSKVKEFDDCENCPAKMVFTLMDGGLDGKQYGWKIVDIDLIKLA